MLLLLSEKLRDLRICKINMCRASIRDPGSFSLSSRTISPRPMCTECKREPRKGGGGGPPNSRNSGWSRPPFLDVPEAPAPPPGRPGAIGLLGGAGSPGPLFQGIQRLQSPGHLGPRFGLPWGLPAVLGSGVPNTKDQKRKNQKRNDDKKNVETNLHFIKNQKKQVQKTKFRKANKKFMKNKFRMEKFIRDFI